MTEAAILLLFSYGTLQQSGRTAWAYVGPAL
jgi:hypothetical protein